MIKFGIQASRLTDAIYVGSISKDGKTFVKKEDAKDEILETVAVGLMLGKYSDFELFDRDTGTIYQMVMQEKRPHYLPEPSYEMGGERVELTPEYYGLIVHNIVSNSFHIQHLLTVRGSITNVPKMAIAVECVRDIGDMPYMLCVYPGKFGELAHENFGTYTETSADEFKKYATELALKKISDKNTI